MTVCRRNRKRAAISVAAILVVSTVLQGCGGWFPRGGGSTASAGLQKFETSLSAAGASLPPLETLTLRTSVGTDQLDSAGRGNATIFADGTQFGEIIDSTGRTVMMGYLSTSRREFSATTTAQALAYLVFGGGFAKGEGRLKILNELPAEVGFPALVAAIQARLDAVGHLDAADPAVQAALENLATSLTDPTRGMIAEPTSGSGLSLDTSVENQLGVENVYLRRVEIFVRRTGYKNADGQDVEDVSSFQRREMPTVARYGGVLGTIDGLFKNEIAYSPVRLTPPLSTPRFPANAQRTDYEVFAVGAGVVPDTKIGIPQEVIDAQQITELKTIFLDGVLVFIASVAIPLEGEAVDDFLKFAGGNAAVTDIINTLRSTVPQVSGLLAQGEYSKATMAVITAVYTSNTILPLISQVMLDWLETKADLTEGQYQSLLGNFKNLFAILGAVDIVGTSTDLVILFADILRSNQFEKFSLRVTEGKITLTTPRTTIRPTSTTVITATIQDKDPNGTYAYEWRVTPNSNYWVEDRSLNGTDDSLDGVLRTSESEVNIRSLVLTAGDALVQCKAFQVIGSQRIEVGTDDITITFDPEAPNSVTNTSPGLLVDKAVVQFLDGGYGGLYAIYMLIPIDPTATGYDFIGTDSDPNWSYFLRRTTAQLAANQYKVGRTGPGAGIPISMNTPPPAGMIKVFLGGGGDGVVGGHTTAGQAQSVIDTVVEGRLNRWRSVQHSYTRFFPE